MSIRIAVLGPISWRTPPRHYGPWESAEPRPAARKAVLGRQTEDDRLAISGREFYWLPCGKMSESELDLAFIEAKLGRMTIRTRRTVERIAARYLSTSRP